MHEPSPIAANLARLRAATGRSQQELAEAAGLSRLALGRIERGDVMPRAGTIAALAEALGVSLKELVAEPKTVRQVRFRATKAVQSRAAILADVAEWIHGYAWLEHEVGDDVRARRLELPLSSRPKSPSAAARKVRELFELGDEPVRDICGLLEQHGVKVLRIQRATDAFFGLSVGPDDGGPAVVINTWDRISVERWIFSAAHELGHLVLHLPGAFDRDELAETDAEEREADEFGSHFLMPEATFDREWDEAAGRSLLDRVLKLKRIFRVSYKTVLHRLVASGKASADVWRQFQRQHRDRFGKTLKKVDEPERLSEADFNWTSSDEPDRLSASDFVEDRLYRLVRQALEAELISMGRAAELLRLSREDMRRLAREW